MAGRFSTALRTNFSSISPMSPESRMVSVQRVRLSSHHHASRAKHTKHDATGAAHELDVGDELPQVIGLAGELFFLRDVMLSTLSPAAAVQSWPPDPVQTWQAVPVRSLQAIPVQSLRATQAWSNRPCGPGGRHRHPSLDERGHDLGRGASTQQGAHDRITGLGHIGEGGPGQPLLAADVTHHPPPATAPARSWSDRRWAGPRRRDRPASRTPGSPGPLRGR